MSQTLLPSPLPSWDGVQVGVTPETWDWLKCQSLPLLRPQSLNPTGPQGSPAALGIRRWSKSYSEKVGAQDPDLGGLSGGLRVGLTDRAGPGAGE